MPFQRAIAWSMISVHTWMYWYWTNGTYSATKAIRSKTRKANVRAAYTASSRHFNRPPVAVAYAMSALGVAAGDGTARRPRPAVLLEQLAQRGEFALKPFAAL
ncbi:MAG TPA: hypothetical protein VFP43_26565 [Mesorhizobium sp.]|nr:hypothetical protein [Mesorhizobium sp.]